MAGFIQDPLQTINLIADNLRDRYKSGFPVLKEIIQNTDDAGGKPSIRLEFGLSQGLPAASHPLLQGPALFFLNDGAFTAADNRAIQSFGLNRKAADAASIGKFGLGMKSVFHFCEAFFYLAKGEGKPYNTILNPWYGGDDYPSGHSTWDEFAEEDQKHLLKHLAPIHAPISQESESWFLLWLPLRQQRHLEGGGGIITEFPGDDPLLLDFLHEPDLPGRLAELLPLLLRLDSIRFWQEEQGSFASRFHVYLEANVRRLARVNEGEKRELEGRTKEISFTGLEQHIASEGLRAIRKSPHWPRSYVRDEKTRHELEAPDKAKGHAAVVFTRRPGSGRGELRIRWAVFLPLEGGKEDRVCDGDSSYLLTLHGYFFVDAGRVGIDGMDGALPQLAGADPATESDLRRKWNDLLVKEAVLPLVLPSLESFTKKVVLTLEEIGILCQALAGSILFKTHRKMICGQSQYVCVLTRSGIAWQLLDAETRVLPLPAPPLSDRERPWIVFPSLTRLEQEYALVDSGAPCLRAASLPQWDESLLKTLLDDTTTDVFNDQGQLDYFLKVLVGDGAHHPFLGVGSIQQRLRHILAQAFAAHGDTLSRFRKKIQEAVSLIGKEGRLVMPKASKTLRILQRLDLSVLLVPKDFDAPDDQGEARLSKEDATTLLRDLDRLVGRAENSTVTRPQDECRELIKLVLSGLIDADRRSVLQQNRTLRLVDAYDCHQKRRRTVSIQDLDEARDNRLLFQFSSGVREEDRLCLAPHLQKAIDEHIFVIQGETARLLSNPGDVFSPCNAEACLESLGLGVKTLRLSGVPNLVQRLAGAIMDSEPQRRGMRYLLHGKEGKHPDTTTPLWVRGHEVSPAWEKVWRQIQGPDSDDGWNLLPKDLVDQIATGKWSGLRIKEIRPEAILEELIRALASLEGSSLTEEERAEILAQVPDKKLWCALALHETLDGGLTNVEAKTYLESSVLLPDGLNGYAVIIKRSGDKRVCRQQDDWLKPLGSRDVATVALEHEESQRFWQEIMATVADAANDQYFKIKLRETPWLPTRRGAPAKPMDVILLPEIADELDRLAAKERDSYLPPSQLHTEVQGHNKFNELQGLFSTGKEGLECLALLLDGKTEYYLGEFEVGQDEEVLKQHLAILAQLPSNLCFPGWPLFHRLVERHNLTQLTNHLIPALFLPVDGQRLFELLQWLKEEHEAKAKGDKSKWLSVYNWTLAPFARSPEARDLLSGVFLLNRDGQWHRAGELCTNVVGIAGKYILDEGQRNILKDIIDEGGASHIKLREEDDIFQGETPISEGKKAPDFSDWEKIRGQLKTTPEQLHDFFSPWEGQVAPETICFFLSLLGDHPLPEMHDLAEKYRGRHSSLEWYRDHIPWKVSPIPPQKRRNTGLYGTAQEVIARHGFIVDVIPGDQPVEVTAITGKTNTVFMEKTFNSFVVGDRPVGFWSNMDFGAVRLRLRKADQETMTPEQFSAALKKTAEYLLTTIYDQTGSLDTIWAELDSSEQLDIRVAERRILKHLPFYLKQLSASKQLPKLRDLLWQWDDADYRAEENQNNKKKHDEYEVKQNEALRNLQSLLKEDTEAQAAVLDAVRAKMNDFQYEPASVPFELFQNADDAAAEQAEIEACRQDPLSSVAMLPEHCRRFLVLRDQGKIAFAHWGRPINSTGSGNFPGRERGYHQDMEKMLILSSSDKESGKVTGKFGLGFKSVLLVCDRPRLVSGRLSFEVVAGMCPVVLPDRGAMLRARLEEIPTNRQWPGTIIELSLDAEVEPQEVLERFSQLAGGLVIFARQLRSLEVRDDGGTTRAADWEPEVLFDRDGCRIEQAEFLSPSGKAERLPAMHFRCGNGGLLLGFGPRGFKKLPLEIPSVWVVAPTKEDTGFGIAMNGEFDLDAGRAKLSGTSEANTQKAKTMGRILASGFSALYVEAEKDWEGFTKRARLEMDLTHYEFWHSLWDVLTDAISGSDSPARQLVRHILTADCGLGAFIASADRVALPTGLWGTYATLTNPGQVRYVLRDLLNTEKNFSVVAKMKAFAAKAKPGQLISKDIHADLCRILPEWGQKRDQWISLQAQDVVDWVVGDGKEVTPEAARELGALIDREFDKQADDKQEEVKTLFKYLRETLTFQTENGQWKKAGELLVCADASQKEYEEESLRAGFAPAGRLLSRKYSGKAIEFFRICRERLKAPVEDMDAWIREADDDKRCAAILYLREGEQRSELLERLRKNGTQGTWIATLDKDSPYFDDWDYNDRDELLLRGLPSLDALRSPPLQETPAEPPQPAPLDPHVILPAIHAWWQQEGSRHHLHRYEQRVYPNGGALPLHTTDDVGGFDRSGWLTLLLLGAFHTIGRTTPEQHRGFIDRCMQRGWWQVFSAERPQERSSEWMGVLEEYFDEQIDSSEYEHWFKQFGSIYRLSRHLDSYVDVFFSLDRLVQAGKKVETILATRAANVFQGGGIDAPPIARTLGKGACFVVRELMRRGVLSDPEIIPYCYAPVGRVRALLSRMGADVDENAAPLDQSQAIHQFLAAHLGQERATFLGHFDIPLQVLAKKENQGIQQQLFHIALDLKDDEEEDFDPFTVDYTE
ncbi:MAG: hypothetical protein A2505_03060 [Deltaproteobacteria bacterium RIFOXYD12_FULL_55_16]|nr:MAG: hypothetical protein A2505_03060 [Deltaproteobacteria bacterium RIFOXYD12_FULL_55_16]